jgi:HEPN domain-containing protein
MDKNKRKMAEGWFDKASNRLTSAKEHSKSHYTYSEAIQEAQESIELSVKSMLLLLDIGFSRSHDWNPNKEEFAKIAEQIQKRQLQEKIGGEYPTINLPRLLFLMFFWGQFYLVAKYGLEAGNLAAAKELFEKQEAELAVQHAEECQRTATWLRYLDEQKLAGLIKR